ncbi:hypothetical protein ACHAXA_002346 [Cyclostephanos tholiformis]|uniref:phosphoribosylaminoimidazolesuccinocarboxamide synthase n=1 Tax=Cyclostephanos tholiformis TaxID=382380 RepID=A0ABD3SRY1_9STRA
MWESRISDGNIDKEFLRLWFRDNCDPHNDVVLPEAPRDLVIELALRYVVLYKTIARKVFDFGNNGVTESVIALALLENA